MNAVMIQPEATRSPVDTALTEAREAATPLDLPIEVFKNALARRKANRAALLEWLKSALVESIDYGRLHVVARTKCPLAAQGRASECRDVTHWSKPSLWKPGAEKIAGILGVTVHYPALGEYEQAALQGVELKTIILRCELQDARGRVVAAGVGARRLMMDNNDLNKSLKMAEKSSHIDATLRMAGLSEVFTQDLEDGPAGAPTPLGADTQCVPVCPAESSRGLETDPLAMLEARLRQWQVDPARVTAWIKKTWGVECFHDLTLDQHAQLLRKLAAVAASADARQRDRSKPEEAVVRPPVAPTVSVAPATPPAVMPPAAAPDAALAEAAVPASKPIPASVLRQLEHQARLKGVPTPAVTSLEEAKAELQRLFKLQAVPAPPSAA